MPCQIHVHDRIIIPIRIHIVTQQSRPCADIPIRIQEPSPLRVIVPALQIVQPRVRIVVLPPIPERIERADNLLLNRCRARLGGNRAVAPCVIGVRAYLGSVFRVDGDDVPLQVLLKVVGVKCIRSIGLVSVLQSDRSAVLIVQIDQQVVEGLRPAAVPGVLGLTDDLRAVQRVPVHRRAVGLFRPDALVIVLEGVQELPGVHGHLHKLAAAPGQGVAVVCSRITNAIV